MSARDEILGRIRAAALDPAPDVPEISRAHHRADSGRGAGDPAVVARFCERAAEYRATVSRESAEGLEAAVAGACAERGARRPAVPAGAPHHLRGLELIIDEPPMTRALDQVDGVLTRCALAVAETGTVVLDGGALSGRRRVLTLVPDFPVCLVQAADVHASVPDAIAALGPAAAAGRPITLLSGPCATSDIELERVDGVHGPRDLVMLVVES